MIYQESVLIKREQETLFNECNDIKKFNEKISSLIGNHRDEDNDFAVKLCELEKNKLAKAALQNILKIKQDLYIATGIKL